MIFAVVISQSKQSLQDVRKHPRLSLIQHHGQHHCLPFFLTALSEDGKFKCLGIFLIENQTLFSTKDNRTETYSKLDTGQLIKHS